MPPDSPPDAVARRDALLAELDTYHEQLIQAANTGKEEDLEELLQGRQSVIEDLGTVAKEAPIPTEIGERLTRREAELQTALRRELAEVRNSLGQNSRRGKAALRYRRSR